MTETTKALRTVIASLPPEDRAALARELAPPQPAEPSPERILRPAEAARRMSCSTRTVRGLCARGALKRITLPGRKNGFGVRERDVEALIAGAVA
jgi:hypothetical protein